MTTPARPRRPQSQEKYTQSDRDLIRAAKEDLTVVLYLDPEDFMENKGIQARVCIVDRYFVQFDISEFRDSQMPVWIAKAGIFAFEVPPLRARTRA